MLREHLGRSFSYATMEDPRAYAEARGCRALLQRVPELFSPIKFIVDQSSEKGRVVLTGLQTYHLMKGVS